MVYLVYMDDIKNIIGGGIITVLIGGAAFSFSQQDLVDNFAAESGLSSEQAEQYVDNVTSDELVSYKENGLDWIEESQTTVELAEGIDCNNYEYDWESPSLSCPEGRNQLMVMGDAERRMGESFMELDSTTDVRASIQQAIEDIDRLILTYDLGIAKGVYDEATLQELRMTHLYNKSILKSALESE